VLRTIDAVGIAPPATLSVIPENITARVPVPVLDVSAPGWGPWNGPSSSALQSVAGIDVVPLPRPVGSQDWSYDLNFFGPSVQCRSPNKTEQAMFDRLNERREREEYIFVAAQMDDKIWNTRTMMSNYIITNPNTTYGNNSGSWLLYSAWSSYIDETAKYKTSDSSLEATILPDYYHSIFLQTSTSSAICSAVNASFDITIASVRGRQQIIQQNITYLSLIPPPVNNPVPPNDREEWYKQVNTTTMYNYQFTDLASVVNGNIVFQAEYWGYWDLKLQIDPSSRGFIACDDIQTSPFMDAFKRGYIVDGKERVYQNLLGIQLSSEPWQCRNRSLLRYIEDLSNNITISYLSSSELTNSDTTFRSLITSDTVNVYLYRPLFLLLSYGIGLLAVIISVLIGLYSVHVNGVSHSNVFSSIIATTRNKDLDILMSGASLGAAPLAEDIKGTRLKFGPLVGKEENEKVDHVAFGIEGTVGILKRDEPYI
jgi:hypothetical protein